jgi:hypothetical protein
MDKDYQAGQIHPGQTPVYGQSGNVLRDHAIDTIPGKRVQSSLTADRARTKQGAVHPTEGVTASTKVPHSIAEKRIHPSPTSETVG